MRDGRLGAVVLAAGRGERMRAPLPKPYLTLRGRPIIWYSLEKFSRSPLVEEIVVVIHPDDRELLRSQVDFRSFEKEIRVVFGGGRRQDSARAGVREISCGWVAVHDAARPLFSPALLERVFEAARLHRAALPAAAVRETVKSVDERGFVLSDIDREGLRLAQTPQCFERALLAGALEEACKVGLYFTDEAGAVLAMSGVRPFAVEGEEQNIKITTPEDLKLAEALLEQLRD